MFTIQILEDGELNYGGTGPFFDPAAKTYTRTVGNGKIDVTFENTTAYRLSIKMDKAKVEIGSTELSMSEDQSLFPGQKWTVTMPLPPNTYTFYLEDFPKVKCEVTLVNEKLMSTMAGLPSVL